MRKFKTICHNKRGSSFADKLTIGKMYDVLVFGNTHIILEQGELNTDNNVTMCSEQMFDYWFYTNEQMRDLKIDKILNV